MVIWTPRARNDLKAIHDYIAQDAPINAKKVTRDILDKATTLADLPPLSGKIVREVNDESLREISIHSWRIIYHLRDQQIYIITLVHKRRMVTPKDF
ncbi:MAG: type II toxin-antitoxin system RelE/ParE family toxin [Ketobacter sp.]|nr:type II toxin-antitoxin system RelE/ParE family toxin [Ketobacter sp.]